MTTKPRKIKGYVTHLPYGSKRPTMWLVSYAGNESFAEQTKTRPTVAQKFIYHVLAPLGICRGFDDIYWWGGRTPYLKLPAKLTTEFYQRRLRPEDAAIRSVWVVIRQWAKHEENYSLNPIQRILYTLKYLACFAFHIHGEPEHFIVDGHDYGARYDDGIVVGAFDHSGPIGTPDGTDYCWTEAQVGAGWKPNTWWIMTERQSCL
jgi:hypothetical protein